MGNGGTEGHGKIWPEPKPGQLYVKCYMVYQESEGCNGFEQEIVFLQIRIINEAQLRAWGKKQFLI